jgi:hypothetical protein
MGPRKCDTHLMCPQLLFQSTEQSQSVLGTEKADLKAAALINSSFCIVTLSVNLLKPTGYVMHQKFNIQQLYVLPTLYLGVLYLSENKQRLVPLTA